MITLDAMLLRGALQVAVFSVALAVIYAGARWLGARAAAATLLWGMVLTLGLTLLVGSPWPRWELAGTPDNSVGAVPVAIAAEQPTAEAVGQNPPVEIASPTLQQFTLSDYAREFTAALTEPQPFNRTTNAQWSWLVLAAIAGAVFGLLRLAVGLVSVQRLSRGSTAIEDERLLAELGRLRDDLAVDARVAVRESGSLSTPATVGWRRPQILLPAGWRRWSEAELRAVLAHELAHIAGRDYVGWIIARLAVAVHFYNPLVRWLAARLQLEQELAADAAAARAVGDRQGYLQTLATLALATPPQKVAGPARTLFPTRSLLMRRVEMLRSPLSTLKSRALTSRLQVAAGCLLALAAVGVAGLRPPASVAEEPAAAAANTSVAIEPIPLTLVPEGTVAAISCFPAALYSAPELAPLLEKLELPMPVPIESLSIRDLHQFLLAVPTGTSNARIVARFHSRQKLDEIMKALAADPRATRPYQNTIYFADGMSQRYSRFDDTTLVYDKGANRQEGKYPKIVNPLPEFAEDWGRGLSLMDLWLDNQKILADGLRRGMAESPQLAMIAPIVEKVDHLTGSLVIDDTAQLELTAFADNADAAQRVADTLVAVRTLGRNALSQSKGRVPAEQRERYAEAVQVLDSALAGLEISADGDRAQVAYETDQSVAQLAELATTLLPAVDAARASARRTQSTNNLKRLALAVHIFYDQHKRLPQASSTDYYDYEAKQWRKSEHPHSWRVTLLPFLEQQALYNAYHFDEPWDSEANMKIAGTLVPVMVDPSSTSSTNASYFMPVGPDTAFPEDKALTFRDIRDGTSKTLLLVQAKRDIPWTKPEDIEVTADGELPELGGFNEGVFLAALLDGSVHTISQDVPEEVLRAMFTRDGREQYDWDKVHPRE